MQPSSAELLGPVLALAEQQRGVLVSRQLRAGGISSKVERQLVSDGWLRPLSVGGYAIAGRPLSNWEAAVAVGLLGGPAAALSHLTAAGIHHFPGLVVPREPEITIPKSRRPRLPGARIHRVADLPACDVERRNGVGVTRPARTLVDLAGRLDPRLLTSIIDEGSIARLWTVGAIAACAERLGGQGRAGGPALRAVLAERIDEPRGDSALEFRMIRVLAPYAPFETQYELVLGGELFILDIAWPWWQIGAEADGWWTRGKSREKFDHDSHKSNVLAAHHWKVAHLTSTMSDATILHDVGRLLPTDIARLRPAGSGVPSFSRHTSRRSQPLSRGLSR